MSFSIKSFILTKNLSLFSSLLSVALKASQCGDSRRRASGVESVVAPVCGVPNLLGTVLAPTDLDHTRVVSLAYH